MRRRLWLAVHRLRHPRRRYFVSCDPATGVTVFGYRDGSVIHITSMERKVVEREA